MKKNNLKIVKIDRKKNIFPFYGRSEFSGLSLEEQRDKIRKGFKIFKKNQIKPTVWVAPAHCFDYITLHALELETDIKIISDGIAYSPYYFKGFYFIPQQLWKLKKKYFGIWTVCLHPDTMSDDEIQEFDKGLALLHNNCSFLDIDKIELIKRNKSLFDQMLNLTNPNYQMLNLTKLLFAAIAPSLVPNWPDLL